MRAPAMKPHRAFAVLLAAVTLALSGGYMFVYLYRWEWNRAVISGIIFLAAEIAVLGAVINGKINALGRTIDADRVRGISRHLSASRARSTRFDWLGDRSRTNVFVPILLGTGLVISLMAWLVEWLARHTTDPLANERLARSLSRLAPPRGGFLDDTDDPLRTLRGPTGGRG